MGAVTAAFGCGISAMRSYASSKTQSGYVMWFFITMLWVLGVPNIHNNYELLTIFGASIATWGLFKTQAVKLRCLMLFNSLCWLTNNLLLGSIGGTLMELTFIAVNLFTISNMIKSEKAAS